MFDWVDYEAECPKCKAQVTGFQSKDGLCTMGHLKPSEVNTFYANCDNCEVWLEFEIVPLVFKIKRISPKDSPKSFIYGSEIEEDI